MNKTIKKKKVIMRHGNACFLCKQKKFKMKCACVFKVKEIEDLISIGEREYVETNKNFEFIIK